MTTYSKETALYDTGAINTGITNAGKTASGYMTNVSNDGVFVHEYDTSNPQPSTTGENGVHIHNTVDVVNDGNVVASYGRTATIGQNADGYSRTEITGDGIDFKRKDGTNDVVLAHIGYATGQATSGTSTKPYYTFGTRSSDTASTRGNYSFAEGVLATASGFASHAEGSETTASGKFSHAEGSDTTASGDYSHAEGNGSTASGDVSHAEGYYSTTNGYGAHVEGYATRASGNVSHVIGMLNKEDSSYYVLTTDSYVHSYKTYYTYNYDAYTPVSNPTDDQISTYYEHLDYEPGERINGGYAFIIGNGLGTRARSNALTVDWNGGIQMYLDSDGTSSSAATSGDDMDLFNAIYDLGWYSDVIV